LGGGGGGGGWGGNNKKTSGEGVGWHELQKGGFHSNVRGGGGIFGKVTQGQMRPPLQSWVLERERREEGN